jgi:hypothetical protein
MKKLSHDFTSRFGGVFLAFRPRPSCASTWLHSTQGIFHTVLCIPLSLPSLLQVPWEGDPRSPSFKVFISSSRYPREILSGDSGATPAGVRRGEALAAAEPTSPSQGQFPSVFRTAAGPGREKQGTQLQCRAGA